ncbi:hypothetical protein [Nocardioides sp. HB32]
MKKLIVGIAGAALLVSSAGSAAFAGPHDGYPGVIKTQTTVSGPGKAKVGQTKTYNAKLVVASDGNPCKGTFDLKVTKGDDTVQTGSKPLGDGNRSFDVTFDHGKGKYVVKVRFIPSNQNACKGSNGAKNVQVKKK